MYPQQDTSISPPPPLPASSSQDGTYPHSTSAPSIHNIISATPTLKVMRLQSPELYQPCAGALGCKSILGSDLCLPDSFGVIHVGETFTAYLGALNPSYELMVTGLSIVAALQTPSRRFTLSSDLDETNRTGGVNVPPASGVDVIVSRSLEEVGQHILRVEVGYGDNKTLRKFYRFNVANPLHIRELTVRSGDASCFVSIAIENATSSSSLTVSKAEFVPPAGLVAHCVGGPKCSGDLVERSSQEQQHREEKGKPSAVDLFDGCGRLDPGASFRYLFLVKADSEDATLRGIAAGDELGKAVFTWRKTMGETGRIASASVLCPPTNLPPLYGAAAGSSIADAPSLPPPLVTTSHKFVVHNSGLSVDAAAAAASRSSTPFSTVSPMENNNNPALSNSPSLDQILPVTVEPIDPPPTMELGIPQEVQLLIVNHSDTDLNLQLQMRLPHMSGVVICGPSFKNLGTVPSSGGSVVVGIRLIPLVAGLFRVQGCWIVDLTSGREIPQPALFSVFVEKSDGGGSVVVAGGELSSEVVTQ